MERQENGSEEGMTRSGRGMPSVRSNNGDDQDRTVGLAPSTDTDLSEMQEQCAALRIGLFCILSAKESVLCPISSKSGTSGVPYAVNGMVIPTAAIFSKRTEESGRFICHRSLPEKL